MNKTFLKAELMLFSENENALQYFFKKLHLYPEILHHIIDDKIILIGESAYLVYVIELIERQLIRRFGKVDFVILSYHYVLLGTELILK